MKEQWMEDDNYLCSIQDLSVDYSLFFMELFGCYRSINVHIEDRRCGEFYVILSMEAMIHEVRSPYQRLYCEEASSQ
uniref:Uncharacterized protein n=1 Tax=Lepeophtheirus salmonis TaxID=72036 RepID=A0A0K2V5D1_LEPSM